MVYVRFKGDPDTHLYRLGIPTDKMISTIENETGKTVQRLDGFEKGAQVTWIRKPNGFFVAIPGEDNPEGTAIALVDAGITPDNLEMLKTFGPKVLEQYALWSQPA